MLGSRPVARFTAIHLSPTKLDEALPLARMAAPMLTAERWRRFAHILDTCSGGVLAAFADDGRPHGFAAYWVDDSLVHGRVLRVEPMVTFEIARAAPVRATLCRALEALATAKSCERLVISTASRGYADTQGAKSRAWASLGMEIGAVSLVKRIEARESAEHTTTVQTNFSP